MKMIQGAIEQKVGAPAPGEAAPPEETPPRATR